MSGTTAGAAGNTGTTANAGIVPFALSPATVDTGLIDYRTSEGSSIYKTTVSPLDTKYAVDGEDLKTFINELQDRSTASRWHTILNPVIKVKSIDLLQLYGTISLDDLKTSCKSYIDQQTRDAQNSA